MVKATYMKSIKLENKIQTNGFDKADKDLDKIKWLGLGEDFRQFVLSDIETELYKQQHNSKLLYAECLARPECSANTLDAKSSKDDFSTIISLSLLFPLLLGVLSYDGIFWELRVDQKYFASKQNNSNKINIKKEFCVISHRQVSKSEESK